MGTKLEMGTGSASVGASEPERDDRVAGRTVGVWDPLVRVGHWTLVAAFFAAYLAGDEWPGLHVWAGYAVGTVVLVRIVWGVVGSRHARFRDFVYPPKEVIAYLRGLAVGSVRRYLGHNPAGGAMVVIMLVCLAALVGSGLVLYALEENAGPLAGVVYPEYTAVYAAADPESAPRALYEAFEEVEDFWEEVHEVLANVMLLLVAVHVAGVVLSSWRHRENLVRAMFTGRKRLAED